MEDLERDPEPTAIPASQSGREHSEWNLTERPVNFVRKREAVYW